MILRFYKHTFRSSCLPPLLLFLLILAMRISGYGSAHPAPADTIIIGGKYLIVESSLEYDTLKTPRTRNPQRPNSSMLKHGILLGFEAVPGVQFNRLRSKDAAFALIDEFVGKGLRAEAAMAANAFAGCRLGKSHLWAFAGVGMEFFTVSGSGTDLNNLSDSVFMFRSFETNTLQAIERFRYPIGVEFDTLDVALRRSTVAFSAVQVPLQLAYVNAINAKLELQVLAGVDVRFVNLSEGNDWLLLSTVDSTTQTINALLPNLYRSFAVSPMLGARIRFQIDKKWSLLAGFRASYIPSAFVNDVVPFTHNALRTSFSLGWTYTYND